MVLDDHIKMVEASWACAEIYNAHRILIESLKERNRLETREVDWRIMLKNCFKGI
jgi:hypothetical protein